MLPQWLCRGVEVNSLEYGPEAMPPYMNLTDSGEALLAAPSNDTDTIVEEIGGHYSLFHGFFEMKSTGDAIGIFTTILFVAISRVLTSRIPHCIPHSCSLLALGMFYGFGAFIFYEDQVKLSKALFFNFMLPIIVFDECVKMRTKPFFTNIGTILTFAVIGTICNIGVLMMFLYPMSNFKCFKNEFKFVDLAIFATIICAVDPVAVLAVLNDIGVNDNLYIIVFGESLLNDAVTIVLYHVLETMHIEGGDFTIASMGTVIWKFLAVSCSGVLIGIIIGFMTAALIRLIRKSNNEQPIVFLSLAFLCYLLSESFHSSGLISIITYGLIMKRYAVPNMNPDNNETLRHVLGCVTSYSESTIFVFLGISFAQNVINAISTFDVRFIITSLITIFVTRFIVTFGLSIPVNAVRSEKITYREQIISAFSGLRGAVCYGLVESLPDDFTHKEVFATVIMVAIIFTTLFQGIAIRPLVEHLNVKMSPPEDPESPHKVTAMVQKIFLQNLKHGIEGISMCEQTPPWYRTFIKLDQEYLSPLFIHDYCHMNVLAAQHQNLMISEMKADIRNGSFAYLPASASGAHLALPNGDRIAANGAHLGVTAPPRGGGAIPHVESATGIAQYMVAEYERTVGRNEGRKSVYNRHQFGIPASPTGREEDQDASAYMTYPYPRGANDSFKVSALQKNQQDHLQPAKIGGSKRRSAAEAAGELRLRSLFSEPKSTSAPASQRPRFSIDDNDGGVTVEVPNVRPTERKVSTTGRMFTLEGVEEELELLPIDESVEPTPEGGKTPRFKK